MPYKDPKNPNNIAYRKRYYQENKDTLWSYSNPQRKESVLRWRKNHPERQAQAVLNYQIKNRKKLIAASQKYWNDNKDTLNKKDRLRTELLTDGYLRKHLNKLGYSATDIKRYPELIESHRTIIKIKRLCKTLKN